MIKTAILTVSDTRKKGNDLSGKKLAGILEKRGYRICRQEIVPDDRGRIEDKLKHYTDVLKLDFVLTTGGTGFSPRDVTPEATGNIIEKEIPGLPEMMRAKGGTEFAYLSRAVAGIRKKTLIVNLPGSPAGAGESIRVILPVLKHALEIIKGHTEHKK